MLLAWQLNIFWRDLTLDFPHDILLERVRIRERLGLAWKHYDDDLDQLLHLRWLGFKPSSIYDIGSSNTVWSVMASLVYPSASLELFEPLAEISDAYLVGKLAHPVIRAFLESANYRIHAVALGNRNGRCSFNRFENDAGSTSLELNKNTPNTQALDLPMHRLDDFVSEKGLSAPDLIKLDTQGSEMEILEGAPQVLAHASVVFVECWLTKGYGPKTPLFLSMANKLSEAGFDLFAIGDEYRGADGVANTKDTVFVKRDLSLRVEPPLANLV